MIVKRRNGRRRAAGYPFSLASLASLATTLLLAGMIGCSAGRSEGVDVQSLPDSVRGDYELFAIRCSKCHSLARPLESGITDDAFWKEYVDRMRRQPSSGISPADEIPILRFLHYYSAEKRSGPSASPPAHAPTPPTQKTPTPTPTPTAPPTPTQTPPPDPAPSTELLP